MLTNRITPSAQNFVPQTGIEPAQLFLAKGF